jgi:hypothetical protein
MNLARTLLPRTPLLGALAVLLAGAAFLVPADAGATTVRHTRAHARRHAVAARPAAARPAAMASPGMVVGIDPETGLLGMPSQDQMLQLSAVERTGMLRSTAGLTSVRRADGSTMVNLQGRFMDYSVARLDAAGRPRLGCVEDSLDLARFLGAGPSAPALEVK